METTIGFRVFGLRVRETSTETTIEFRVRVGMKEWGKMETTIMGCIGTTMRIHHS